MMFSDMAVTMENRTDGLHDLSVEHKYRQICNAFKQDINLSRINRTETK
jgi:hypothetical protein